MIEELKGKYYQSKADIDYILSTIRNQNINGIYISEDRKHIRFDLDKFE